MCSRRPRAAASYGGVCKPRKPACGGPRSSGSAISTVPRRPYAARGRIPTPPFESGDPRACTNPTSSRHDEQAEPAAARRHGRGGQCRLLQRGRADHRLVHHARGQPRLAFPDAGAGCDRHRREGGPDCQRPDRGELLARPGSARPSRSSTCPCRHRHPRARSGSRRTATGTAQCTPSELPGRTVHGPCWSVVCQPATMTRAPTVSYVARARASRVARSTSCSTAASATSARPRSTPPGVDQLEDHGVVNCRLARDDQHA